VALVGYAGHLINTKYRIPTTKYLLLVINLEPRYAFRNDTSNDARMLLIFSSMFSFRQVVAVST
jgi:hypothetical protein